MNRVILPTLILGLAAATPVQAQTPAPRDTPRERPVEHPEDRPFTGNPGPEPPPPPRPPRKKKKVRPEPRRPAAPRRPARPVKPVEPKRKDLIDPPGSNVIYGGLGFTAGLTEHSTGGGQLSLGWSYQMSRMLWFDLLGNLSFGGKCESMATDSQGRPIDYECGGFRGIGIDLLAGIQFKFVGIKLWKAPVVPFLRLGVGVAFIISDGPNDGAALIGRVAGGARYYFTPKFSLGGELAFRLGPAWRNHLPLGFYAAIDVLAGVEFLF